MRKIVIFASGRGSNAEAIYLDSQKGGYEISAIITDNAKALIVEKTRAWKLPCYIVAKQFQETRTDHEARILKVLKELDFDLIVLAGYNRLLSGTFLNHFPPQSVLNIHPSLLPAYPGLDSYARAFQDGVKESGITIHYVDEGMDTGEIIAQFHFKREAEDTLENFEKRGLQLEHLHYPAIIRKALFANYIYRLEIFPISKNLVGKTQLITGKVFWVKTEGAMAKLGLLASEVLSDSVVEETFFSHVKLEDHLKDLKVNDQTVLEVSFLPGVTDNTGFSATDALKKIPDFKNRKLTVYSGKLHFTHEKPSEELVAESYKDLANSWLEKVKIQDLKNGLRFFKPKLTEVTLEKNPVKNYDLNLTDEALVELSNKELWALSLVELTFIRDYFNKLKRSPTDVEMEIIAQTWSEHCKHKIFAATIEHEDEEGKREVKSLFKTFIKGATSRIIEERKIDWARSVFTDNAGIVRWDENLDVCIKVETHNSPSALDPYGGALTGILGVNRDILGCGLGAKPIANTDVFCLPPENADADKIWPTELHSPTRLRAGVHRGVKDGGNKSGIPTVNGAFYYDASYAGKPLVYCGTIGVLPHEVCGHESHEKNQKVDDLVVMFGGRIGKDGIHGATFSSLELKEGTPSTVVQIGDPLTQKRVTDFLLKARDLDLYTSITDNGAGGLSSSVGEMATLTNGAIIDLSLAPLKYLGLSVSEIMISESQERMTCSVNPKRWKEFKNLADTFGVEATSLGKFTSDGFLTILFEQKEVAKLPLSFLHEDLPPMKLKSTWKKNYERKPWKPEAPKKNLKTIKDKILALLSHPNIKSHESWVRQYDHEVKAASVLKPFTPEGGPTDAGVIAMKPHGGGVKNGLVISSGLAPQVCYQDARLMAMFAIDEAVRNAIVTGADPERMVLVDNFCWPDPLPGPRNPDYSQKLGELVRANEGLYEMAVTLGMPFVSGKDSMKNDAIVNFQGNKTKISVLPTLLITAMGHMPDVNKTVTSTFSETSDLWAIGLKEDLNPYTLSTLCQVETRDWLSVAPVVLKERYLRFHKAIEMGLIQGAHDVSDGGVVIALIEMSLNSKCGLDINLYDEKDFFGEGMGMIVFATQASDQDKILKIFPDAKKIAKARSDAWINVKGEKLSLSECLSFYRGEV